MTAVLLMNKARVRMDQGREADAGMLVRRAAAALPEERDTYAVAANWITLGMLRRQLPDDPAGENGRGFRAIGLRPCASDWPEFRERAYDFIRPGPGRRNV